MIVILCKGYATRGWSITWCFRGGLSMDEDDRGNNKRDYDWENRARIFVEKLQSVLELEEQGEISPESVVKIKELLMEFWREKSDHNSE
jgi:hypothetical protein